MDLGLHGRASGEEEGPAFMPRRGVRMKVQEVTSLRGTGARPVDVTVCDLSTAGFMAECLRPVLIGSYISLDLPGIGPVQAQIRWQLGGRLGGKFLDPISVGQCDWVAARG